MSPASTIEIMTLDGGLPCLDFVNSGYDTQRNVIVERLHSYTDLLVLTQRLALLDNDTIAELKKKAEVCQLEAQQALHDARRVRQEMFALFVALAQGKLEQLLPKALETFNDQLARAQSNRELAIQNGQPVMAWTSGTVQLQQPLWAYVLSAQELLLKQDHHFIKQCSGCQWLFLDQTKNHRRKWCDMQSCGSSEKSRRYYQKKKQQAS